MFEKKPHCFAPVCPKCGALMELNRALPKLGERPQLEIFECRACREFTTQAVEDKRRGIDWDKLMKWV